MILTMPGFGARVLEELFSLEMVGNYRFRAGIIGGSKIRWMSRLRASIKRAIFPKDSYIQFRDTVLSATHLSEVLKRNNVLYESVHDDGDVRGLINTYRPDLILTITSRIVYSPQTILSTSCPWLNVHPGILPKYAGAAPAPYMYMDSLGGSTIHVMAEEIDAGAIVDCASFSGELGKNVGEYFFEILPAFVAGRITFVLSQWENATLKYMQQDASKLEYCTNVRLAHDRLINWYMESETVLKWIRSLYPLAPALLKTPRGETMEILRGMPLQTDTLFGMPGLVVAAKGRLCDIETSNGLIRITTSRNPFLSAGDRLDLVPENNRQ